LGSIRTSNANQSTYVLEKDLNGQLTKIYESFSSISVKLFKFEYWSF
jgi:hypothetical protein